LLLGETPSSTQTLGAWPRRSSLCWIPSAVCLAGRVIFPSVGSSRKKTGSLYYSKSIPLWAFALDVLEACRRPLSARALHNVNWFAMDWQHELLARADREPVLELLTRYTPEFAYQATRAVVVLEELCGADSQPHAGVALDEALSHPWRVICAAVPGRQSPLAQH
jgi:hypothetical protein